MLWIDWPFASPWQWFNKKKTENWFTFQNSLKIDDVGKLFNVVIEWRLAALSPDTNYSYQCWEPELSAFDVHLTISKNIYNRPKHKTSMSFPATLLSSTTQKIESCGRSDDNKTAVLKQSFCKALEIPRTKDLSELCKFKVACFQIAQSHSNVIHGVKFIVHSLGKWAERSQKTAELYF